MLGMDARNRRRPKDFVVSWSRGRGGAGRGIGAARALLAASLFGGVAVAASARAGSSYLAVWSSDKGSDDQRLNTDFLAVIDADPRSATYGKMVNTAAVE